MFLGLSYQKPCHTALCSLDSPGRVLSRHCRLSCVVHVAGAGSAALLSNALAFFHPQPPVPYLLEHHALQAHAALLCTPGLGSQEDISQR